ncbi:hypothetical protein HII36_48180 [Nonomuraea sp. NN258]|uniref:hypothetical protein n=1 Tax=Nonomuraea antri TaxID=2730852 RepID=UPI0015687A40|nr:hypothetical protein [Nonomuraea antri]NRQ39558.1 hypothetical protein [Nonomuraea antri]
MDLFRDDPMARPLTYPGRLPGTSGVLVGDRFVPLRPVAGAPPERWRADRERLGDLLGRLGRAPMTARHPVVAVGSNASPAQLRRKYAGRPAGPVLPMTLAVVPGLAPGVSAHVSRWGYVPAAPIEAPGESWRLFVLWPDDDELAALDATEPNYLRLPLPSRSGPVTAESGAPLPPCSVYVGRHGCLAGADGRARRLTGQAELIQALLDESPALRALCGGTPADFLAAVRETATREAARALFRAERRALPQPGLNPA